MKSLIFLEMVAENEEPEPEAGGVAGTPVQEASDEETAHEEAMKPSRSLAQELLGLESSDEEEKDAVMKPSASKVQVESDEEAGAAAVDRALLDEDEEGEGDAEGAQKTVPGDGAVAEEPAPPEVELPPIEAEMPRLDLSLSDEMHLLRLPNFLSIEPHPFHPATYADEAAEEALDEEGRMRLKLRVENTIRWRFRADDQRGRLRGRHRARRARRAGAREQRARRQVERRQPLAASRRRDLRRARRAAHRQLRAPVCAPRQWPRRRRHLPHETRRPAAFDRLANSQEGAASASASAAAFLHGTHSQISRS